MLTRIHVRTRSIVESRRAPLLSFVTNEASPAAMDPNLCSSMTGITEPALLRASHIIPWTKCPDDAKRLNIFNGLLLSALCDAAFDRGLVTFDDEGRPQFAADLGEAARSELRWYRSVALTDRHRERLAWHRTELFVESKR